jgi:hypothetical protein
MNALLGEVRRSLSELAKGLDGQLNMSEAMEDLASALSRNEVRVHTLCGDGGRPGVCQPSGPGPTILYPRVAPPPAPGRAARGRGVHCFSCARVGVHACRGGGA